MSRKRGRWILAGVLAAAASLSYADSTPIRSALEYRSLGYRAQHQGDFEKALYYYLKALQVQPDLVSVHNDLGIVYEELEDWESAEDSYLTALKMDPDYVQAYSNLAQLYESRKNKQKAAEYWSKRAELGSPEDPWTKRAQEQWVKYQGMQERVSTKDAASQKKKRSRVQGNLPDRVPIITVAPLNLVDIDFKVAMERLTEMSGVEIELDESAIQRAQMSQSLKVTLVTAEYLPLTDVLTILLSGTNLKYRVQENRIFISDQII